MRWHITLLLYIVFSLYSNAQNKVIVIDPGHDWDNTTGILSPARTETEVNTNWAVANKLKDEIETRYDPSLGIDWHVELTRENNDPESNVTLDDRERIANNLESANNGKVYFLSIHCNGGGGTGTETFYCNHGFSSNNNLLMRYATSIHSNMVEYGEWVNRRIVDDNSYYGYHLGVLDNLTMPNCLSEIGFVDSDDETKLLNDNWRAKFAQAYFEGFRETFADLHITSYNIEQRPDFYSQPNLTWCKINVVVKESQSEIWDGEIRASLRYLPTYSYESPTSEHCKLGDAQSVEFAKSGQTTLTFQDNVPLTIDLGLALQLESRKTGSAEWKIIPTPSHRKIIKVPINGVLIDGTLYNDDYIPEEGIEIWSWKYTDTKSVGMVADPLSTLYDPTMDRTDKNGKFEIILPYEWGQAKVAVKNYSKYDEVLISPIADNTLTFYDSPIIYVPWPETCNDGEQNQDEIGIDCGGVCSPCGLGGNLTDITEYVSCGCGQPSAGYGVPNTPLNSGFNIMNRNNINITHGQYYGGTAYFTVQHVIKNLWIIASIVTKEDLHLFLPAVYIFNHLDFSLNQINCIPSHPIFIPILIKPPFILN
ncbi:MAG: N-acetylmuramoyl-L-alanine amidase [Chloroflexia bacterium]|nr:N-acetylmuramoyl-L-alanine amidase [Chloroflexia bacterium]